MTTAEAPLTAAAQKAARKSKASEDRHLGEVAKLEAAAARHISNYFRGMDLPASVNLRDRRYIEMCVGVNICDAVDAAYKSMRQSGLMQHICGDGTMSEDIRFVIRLLKEIRAKCVPQEFSAGIFLMHLEIVEGLRF